MQYTGRTLAGPALKSKRTSAAGEIPPSRLPNLLDCNCHHSGRAGDRAEVYSDIIRPGDHATRHLDVDLVKTSHRAGYKSGVSCRGGFYVRSRSEGYCGQCREAGSQRATEQHRLIDGCAIE